MPPDRDPSGRFFTAVSLIPQSLARRRSSNIFASEELRILALEHALQGVVEALQSRAHRAMVLVRLILFCN